MSCRSCFCNRPRKRAKLYWLPIIIKEAAARVFADSVAAMLMLLTKP